MLCSALNCIQDVYKRQFLLDVGLDYRALNRSSVSLSGGESQRIRLATQIGSQLVNVPVSYTHLKEDGANGYYWLLFA